jgi:hypothetical protein
MSELITSPRRLGSGFVVALVALSACGESSSEPGGGAGAASGSGGAPATGGRSNTGATPSTSTGGVPSSPTGGAPPAAGGVSSGGSAGAPSATGGGPNATGGAPNATGGIGGRGAEGGTAAVGGGNGPAGSGGVDAGGVSGGSSGAKAGGGSGGAVASGATIVPDPSWACGLPGGIVAPERGKLAFTISIELGDIHDVGATQYGERRLLDMKSGMLKGDDIQATLLAGGLDLELTLSNGSVELEQLVMLRASDNSLIFLRTCGVAPVGDSVVRVVPDFEVANSSALSWLNTGKFVGTRTITGTKLELAVYDVANVAAAEPRVQLEDPPSDPDQPWECSKATGSRGTTVFTETVGIGSSLSVGASKRGTRNVIPITGGTTTGRVAGSVLPGGADFQLIGGGSTVLDARYTVATNDDEYIIIRNCGPFGAMIPLFEARAAGPYAFLNEDAFMSSDPGGASGGVSITFYERN